MGESDSTVLKTCTKCSVEKPVSEFYKHKRVACGFGARCKDCTSAYQKDRYATNAERIKENSVAWYAANAQRMRVAAVNYRVENKKKVTAYNKYWCESNADRKRQSESEWRAANPDLQRVYRNNRRARKIKAGGELSPGLAGKLFKLQKGMCPCCKQPLGDDYHIDHIHPLALGGNNTDENAQLLRKKCNLQKNAKHPIDFMQSRGYLL